MINCSRIRWLLFIGVLFLIVAGLMACRHNREVVARGEENIYIVNGLDDIRFSRGELELTVSDILERSGQKESEKGVQILHPYNNAVFPKDMASPLFSWKLPDTDPRDCVIRIKLQDTPVSIFVLSRQTIWVPEKEIWDFIKTKSTGKTAAVTVFAHNYKTNKVQTSNEYQFSTSSDSVGAPIVYQQMMIPIEVSNQFPETAKWLMGDVSSYEKPRVVLEKQNSCGMCHHFSADGRVFGLDMDIGGDKGAYGLSSVKNQVLLKQENFISWTKFQNNGETTLGLFSKISPNGNHVVSTIREKRLFVQINDLDFSELFFPYEGILACYNRVSNKFFNLPGADDPNFVHVGPDWSPDGKYIVFSRAKSKKKFDAAMKGKAFIKAERLERINDLNRKYRLQYDLYRIPFNNGKGGVPKPLKGAFGNGKSNYWPRYSPDGKWIVFTQSDNAMMNQPESELYIISSKGGKARRMSCSRKYHNSWHSWSPNSKWLVFSSKVNTPFTQIFIAHVDDKGNDSPPVLLSRFNSKRLASVMPEFANIKPGEFKKVIVDLQDQ